MLKERVNQLFIEQLNDWEQAKNNYKALEQSKIKILDVAGHTYKVQYNPARYVSSAADCKSVYERPCFLCASNRSTKQNGVPFKDQYVILINPYPIFTRHFTIAANEHVPQLIASRFEDMLELARQLDDHVVFYN
ncbi:MAG: DUF4922 domain-containing protein, partial [Tannerella sp.]|nr:DUF4922 domain-containing protein [Tannerella sp.]